MEQVKITSFELENVKRVKAVAYKPTQSGLTVIGGRNGQGKTSVLDAIAWTLGGAKFKPSTAEREGSYNPPKLQVTMNNGLVVTRTGANNTLKVLDPDGKKSGQRILDEFISQLALDLPKFMDMTPKEKANELLKLLGVEAELTKLEVEHQRLYSDRHAIGQIATQKDKYAKELVAYDDAPAEPVSASELIQQQQAILLTNAENKKKREQAEQLEVKYHSLKQQIEKLQAELEVVTDDLVIAKTDAQDLKDQSTAELEAQIQNVDAINQKVRANQERARALQEAADYKLQYDELTDRLEEIREAKTKLLESVAMPLEGLSITDGEVEYNGRRWDCMSGAEQLKVATAIVQALNPKCGFVLMDKLEQMDVATMQEFGQWLEEKGLQVIATRVTSNADECSIIIEDGRIDGDPIEPAPATSEAADANTENDWGDF